VAIPHFELVVRGGTILSPGHHEIADVGIRDGRIAQIDGAMTGAGGARRARPAGQAAIAVGSDADLALWDPQKRMTIDGARMQSRAGYSVYDGWTVQGWPRFVIRRGQVVLADGSSLAQPGQGRWVRRAQGAAWAGNHRPF
jgi:dihydroorotase-like cyclic amidohydrolase